MSDTPVEAQDEGWTFVDEDGEVNWVPDCSDPHDHDETENEVPQ